MGIVTRAASLWIEAACESNDRAVVASCPTTFWEPDILMLWVHRGRNISLQNDVVSELALRVGADVVVAPDVHNVQRHTRDFGVPGDERANILALTYPQSTQQVAAILKFCNERRIAVQPQGGMTGMAGGAVPVGPCVVISLERMRAIKELDVAAGTITVEAGVVMDTVQKAADAADLFFPLDLGGRDSPGEWQRTLHWPQLKTVYFGHVADGNLHASVRMNGHSVPELAIEDAVYSIVSRRKGSISAEHGIGSLKREFLHYSRSPEELALMRAIKQVMDPNGILNPGKVL
jgi:FAD/FMN-containing dehydrogenase